MNVSNPQSRLYPFLLLAIILVSFILAGYQSVVLNTGSDALDQGAYLSLGLATAEDQRLTDPYRQPLLSWVLAIFATRDMSYFTWAKLVTLATGVFGVIGCYLVSRWLYHRPVIALLSAFLLASNTFFVQQSSIVMVEPLLASIMLFVWFFGLRALTRNHWRAWAAGGFATGIAFLAKESGLFWLPAWGIGTVIANRLNLGSYRKFLLFLVLVFLTVSPVFVHNVIRYGEPVLTDNMSTMWLDDWEEFFTTGPDAQVTLNAYLEHHTWGDITGRLLDGMLMMGVLTVSVFVPFRLDQKLCGDWCQPYGPLIAIVLVAAALALFHRQAIIAYCRNKLPLVAFTLCFSIAYFLAASWYVPVTFDPRFVTPVLSIGYVMLGGALLRWWEHSIAGWPAAARQISRVATIALGAAILIWTVSVGSPYLKAESWANPFEEDLQANSAEVAVLDALNRTANGSVIVYQPSHALPIWMLEGRSTVIPVPYNANWPEFTAYLDDRDAGFVVMTPELYSRRQGLFRHLFYPAATNGTGSPELHPALGIRVLPAAWELVYASQGLPSSYYVFRLLPLPDGETARLTREGDAWSALGNWDRAEDEYRSALTALEREAVCGEICRQSKAQVLRALAQVSALRGDSVQGLAYLDEALELEPEDAWFRTLRGDLLSTMGSVRAAADAYESALEIPGTDWGNLPSFLAWTESKEGRSAAAIAGYRHALQISPDDAWFQVLMGRSLVAYGLPGEAIALYHGVLEQGLRWPFVRRWLADAYQADGETTMAAETLDATGDTPVSFGPPIVYENGLQLKGYTVADRDYTRDGHLQLNLHWVPPPYAGWQYRVHVKLINAVHGVWAEGQGDLHRRGIPGGAWASEAELRDTIALHVKPGTPRGAYDLVLDIQDVTLDEWLEPANRNEVRFGPVELPGRTLRPDQLDSTDTLTANFGDAIGLLGYRVDGEWSAGNTVSLTLFWESLDKIDTPYTVFTHLTDASGRIWAQKDNEPADGFYPTTSWQLGETVRDQYELSLPTDLPPGEKTLRAGLYDARTGQRLRVTGEMASQTGDSIILATIMTD